MTLATAKEIQLNDQNALVLVSSNERELILQYENLGMEIKQAQQSFSLSVRITIQHACDIGRIAFEARECIRNLPTKVEKAKIEKIPLAKLDYKKPTFEQWIEAYTGIGKDTVYSMIRLYEILRNNPDYDIPDEMGWKECLGFFSNRQKLQENKNANLTNDDSDGDADSDEENIGFKSERKAFNETYEKVDGMFAKFLSTSKNEEFKSIIASWKNHLTNDISARKILMNE